jgi:hypothetical protein
MLIQYSYTNAALTLAGPSAELLGAIRQDDVGVLLANLLDLGQLSAANDGYVNAL